VVVFLLSKWLSYTMLLLLAGAVMIGVVVFVAITFPHIRPRVKQRKGIGLRRRYWLFYTLTFLSGARRQIFVAFAVFLLVANHAFTVREIALLFLVNSFITMFLGPLIGRLIQSRGERYVVMLEYSGLLFVFLGYTMADSRWLLIMLYLLDHIFFNMSIAIRTYFQKIADPADVAPSMAVSFTINHIAAVLIPPLGGLLWLVDFRLTFYLGVVLSMCSLVFATQIRFPSKTETAPSSTI
jgi:predicted MFS family arabinose efflux permease